MTTGDEAVPVRPAATVILVRDGDAGLEALLVRRAAELVFHGGAWVFPGGRIDAADYPPGDPHDDDTAALAAAVREAREEASLDIDPSGLRPFAHWTTPPGQPRRFATWFFLAVAPPGEAVHDGREIADHRWFTPAAALAARALGEIELPAPTFVSLLRLADCADAAQAMTQLETHPYLRYVPRPVRLDDGIVSLYEGDIAYDDPSAFDAASPRHRLWMTASEWRYERTVRPG